MKILVLPKYAFQKNLEKITGCENCFAISIMDPEFKEPLYPDKDNYHTWWFYDVDEQIGNFKPIEDWQAKEIYDFIDSNRNKDVCFVHCAAGVSRSGAVGLFINDLMEQDYREFMKTNPNVQPNTLISSKLNKIYRENG